MPALLMLQFEQICFDMLPAHQRAFINNASEKIIEPRLYSRTLGKDEYSSNQIFMSENVWQRQNKYTNYVALKLIVMGL